MAVPAPSKCRDQREHNQWQGDEGQQDVGGEEWEIKGGDPPMITGGFFADVNMINNITNQEQGR